MVHKIKHVLYRYFPKPLKTVKENQFSVR